MSVYNELMTRVWRAYRDASNGFHPPEAQRRIDDAFVEFRPAFEQIGTEIDKKRAGLYPTNEIYLAETRNTLRVLDADLDVLKSAVEAAARADRDKVARVIVDQSVAVRKAKVQQQADNDMVSQVEKIIGQARDDVRIAGEIPPPKGGPLDMLQPVDVAALEKSIKERASAKEDAIAAQQIAVIGGQDTED
ncbi:MAG TPA: hypothetical protein VGG48_00820 [Rhizomicrobium sp.]|jgi:hypothetical protein